jgi:hypothetical protein
MSHIAVGVIIPNDIALSNSYYEYVENILSNFDTSKKVEAYINRTSEELDIERLEYMKRVPEDVLHKISNNADYVEYYYGQNINADGKLYSIYNKDGKWDWWSIGGRWNGDLRDDNICTVMEHLEDIMNNKNETLFALIKDNKWYEKGQMGYWGIVRNVDDVWDSKYIELLKNCKMNDYIVLVDCHV